MGLKALIGIGKRPGGDMETIALENSYAGNRVQRTVHVISHDFWLQIAEIQMLIFEATPAVSSKQGGQDPCDGK